jgi:hypothetical protein
MDPDTNLTLVIGEPIIGAALCRAGFGRNGSAEVKSTASAGRPPNLAGRLAGGEESPDFPPEAGE